MKKTKFKLAPTIMFLSLVMSSSMYAQDEIEPPPTAPIDDYIFPFVIFAFILGLYLVYKRNFKKETK